MKPDLLAAIGPKPLELSVAERDAILEIAFLTIAADHVLSEEEELAFRAVAGLLAGRRSPLSSDEAGRIFAHLKVDRTREESDERLRTLARALPKDARNLRPLAYKVAYALAMADLATGDEEFEFDLQLIDALELPPSEADDLAGEVMNALARPE